MAKLENPGFCSSAAHFSRRGLLQAMLYVDETNPRAVALYRRLGFAHWSTDVSFRRVQPA